MRRRRSNCLLSLVGILLLAVLLTVANGNVLLARSSTTALGVSLTILAGCSAQTENGNKPGAVTVTCDNTVPYRVQFYPALITVARSNAANGAPHIVDVMKIVVRY